MESWQCPRCTRSSFLADGSNGRPTRKVYTGPDGQPIETEHLVFYCSACDKCFEGIQAPEPPAGERIRKKNIDHEGILFNTDGTVVSVEKMSDK